MRAALALARRGLGRTAPNPTVGCVIAKDGRIIAAARTADNGRPHAEKLALQKAGAAAKGAHVYVTLEPCSHEGQSGSCAKALIAAEVAAVTVAYGDPNPCVNGQGLALLQRAGIEVRTGVCESEAKYLNQGFFLTQTQKRPFITLKTAISADGKVALPGNKPVWLTNPLAGRKAHQLRAQHDAILCGIGTVLADDPQLTTRVDGLKHKALRVVLDRNLRIPIGSKLVQMAHDEPLCIMHETRNMAQIDLLRTSGAEEIYCPTSNLSAILKKLTEKGVTRLLIEGGPIVHRSFIEAGLYDEIAIFQTPHILGQGVDAFPAFQATDIKNALNLRVKERIYLGDNILTIYQKA